MNRLSFIIILSFILLMAAAMAFQSGAATLYGPPSFGKYSTAGQTIFAPRPNSTLSPDVVSGGKFSSYTSIDRVTATQLANYTTAKRTVRNRQATFSGISTGQIKASGSITTTSSISVLFGSTTDYFSVGGSLYSGNSIARSLTSGLYFYPQYITDTNTDSTTQASFNIASFPTKANRKTGDNQNFVNISPVYNQASGTAANTDLRINRTETAIGSGTQRLFSAGTGGGTYVEKFGIDNTGNIATGVTTPSITTAAGDAKLLIGSTSAYDNGNHRLGIGTTSPRGTMDAYSSAKGKGRVYAGSAANYGVFDQALGLRYAGNTTTWDDSMTPAALFRTGGTALTFADCGNGIFLNRFDVGDIFYVQVQMPHLMKQNTTLYPHLHLMVNSAIGATGYNVAVSTSHSWSNINSAFPVVTTVNPQTSVSVANSAQYKHFVYPFAPIVPTAGQGGISSMLMYKVERITASIEPLTPATSLFVLGLDIHYESDGSASDEEFVKQ